MLGGASRETWSFSAGGRPLVLRRDPDGAPRSGGLPREAALMLAAGAAGVPVPEVVSFGPSHLVMSRLSGETLARRILRDDEYAAARGSLVGQCAAALGRLHRGVSVAVVADLPRVIEPVAELRAALDELGDPHPVFELALSRLASSPPREREPCVVHGDFRLGNLMVDATGLVGVLDWELAHVGSPVEDLGWLCVRSWRFASALPVAGVGTRAELLSAYGADVSLDELAWWELYGTVRWGVICGQQAAAHLSGAVRSVELAAIGRRTAEVALDVLELLAPDAIAAELARPSPVTLLVGRDRPTSGELLDAVGEWVAGLDLSGRAAFETRVVRRVLGIVARDVALRPALAAVHEQRLADLGVPDDVTLSAQIRAGRDGPEVVAALVAATVDRLRIADPGQLER